MEVITSSENAKVKRIIRLSEKKHRDAEKFYVCEGARWVFDAVEKCADIDFIAVSESQYVVFEERLGGLSQQVFVFADNVFKRMSQVESSQGILAVLQIGSHAMPLKSERCLFLDRLRDPGNLGTIIRTACAAGYTDIILHNCVDAYSPKTVRTSMSAILNVRLIDGGAETLDEARRDGYTVIAADIDGVDVFSSKVKPSKTVLVIGSEAEGIGSEILARCDLTVKLPMENIESLNAAVSAGILMYVLNYVK